MVRVDLRIKHMKLYGAKSNSGVLVKYMWKYQEREGGETYGGRRDMIIAEPR